VGGLRFWPVDGALRVAVFFTLKIHSTASRKEKNLTRLWARMPAPFSEVPSKAIEHHSTSSQGNFLRVNGLVRVDPVP